MADPPSEENAKGKAKQLGPIADSEPSHSQYSTKQNCRYRDDLSPITSCAQSSISALLHSGSLTMGQADHAEGSSSNKAPAISSALTTFAKGETSLFRSAGSRVDEAAFREKSTIDSTAGLRQYDRFLGARGDITGAHPSSSSLSVDAVPNSDHPRTQKRSVDSEFAQQMARDGASVAELLALPGLEDVGADWDGFTTTLSTKEVSELRRAFFGSDLVESTEEPSMASDWDSLLNFQPDFILDGRSKGMYQHLGVRTGEEASALWLNMWKDVLARYNDEVWGALEPLVQEARRELGSTGNTQPSTMALDRLRQILGHIRNPSDK